jgi:hypothetical protein
MACSAPPDVPGEGGALSAGFPETITAECDPGTEAGPFLTLVDWGDGTAFGSRWEQQDIWSR